MKEIIEKISNLNKDIVCNGIICAFIKDSHLYNDNEPKNVLEGGKIEIGTHNNIKVYLDVNLHMSDFNIYDVENNILLDLSPYKDLMY